MTNHSTAAICRTLRIGRATPYRSTRGRPEQYAKADDPVVAAQIREIVRQRGSYGYRRVTALVNRTFDTGYNRKRWQRMVCHRKVANWSIGVWIVKGVLIACKNRHESVQWRRQTQQYRKF